MSGKGPGDGDPRSEQDGSALEPDSLAAGAEGLKEALDNLEALLGTRGDDEQRAKPEPSGPRPLAEPGAGAEDGDSRRRFLDAQYSIPLLDDVVVPPGSLDRAGDEARHADEPAAGVPHRARGAAHDLPEADDTDDPGDEAALAPAPDPEAALLAKRLASEVEVIVNTRAEAAIRAAVAEIKREVHRHIEIVLPEILDELSRKDGGRGRD